MVRVYDTHKKHGKLAHGQLGLSGGEKPIFQSHQPRASGYDTAPVQEALLQTAIAASLS